MDTSLRDVLTDAIHYWERRRILYNLALALIVVAVFVANWPASQARLGFDLAQRLFILAVLANITYCAAYPVDLFAQLSAIRATWLRFRWLLFVIGMVFAAIIARMITQSMLSHAA